MKTRRNSGCDIITKTMYDTTAAGEFLFGLALYKLNWEVFSSLQNVLNAKA